MKTIITAEYQCEVCGGMYRTTAAAICCEVLPVTKDYGVKVGDVVLITKGEGDGTKATVTKRRIIAADFGPPRYHHTVAVYVDLIDGRGSRMLLWDCYTPTLKS